MFFQPPAPSLNFYTFVKHAFAGETSLRAVSSSPFFEAVKVALHAVNYQGGHCLSSQSGCEQLSRPANRKGFIYEACWGHSKKHLTDG